MRWSNKFDYAESLPIDILNGNGILCKYLEIFAAMIYACIHSNMESCK